MPSLGWGLGKLFELPPFFAVGLILVSCCPGGTASNVIAFLARADVALSVSMTTFSTLAAIVFTPFLTSQLSGNYVNIPAEGLYYSTLKVVLIPIDLGEDINKYYPKKTYKIILKSTIKEKKKKKHSVHGGKYYDFSFLDDSSPAGDSDGEE